MNANANVNANVLPAFEVFVKGAPVLFTSAFLTFEAARDYLTAQRAAGRSVGNFAADLLAKPKLSEMQRAWVHKLATDLQARQTRSPRAPAPQADGLNLLPIVRMMDHAHAAGRQFPRVTLRTDDGQNVVLHRAGSASSHCGTVQLTDGGPFGNNVWFGRIELNGAVTKGRGWTLDVELLLRALAVAPAVLAGRHGLATGRCCYCGRALTTKESRSVGYGPDCAEKFGLPWGDTTAADAADAAARVAAEQLTAAPPAEPQDPLGGLL